MRPRPSGPRRGRGVGRGDEDRIPVHGTEKGGAAFGAGPSHASQASPSPSACVTPPRLSLREGEGLWSRADGDGCVTLVTEVPRDPVLVLPFALRKKAMTKTCGNSSGGAAARRASPARYLSTSAPLCLRDSPQPPAADAPVTEAIRVHARGQLGAVRRDGHPLGPRSPHRGRYSRRD